MPEDKEREQTPLWQSFETVRDGVLNFGGMRAVILPSIVLTNIEVAGRRVIGQGLDAILYLAGEMTVGDLFRVLKQDIGDLDMTMAGFPMLQRFLTEQTQTRGFGRVEIELLDPEQGHIRFRLYDSPFAEPSGASQGTACYFPAGVFGGILTALQRGEVRVRERQCLAKEGGYCEFVSEPSSPVHPPTVHRPARGREKK